MTYAPHNYVKLLAGDEAGEYGVVHAQNGTVVMVERISGKQAKSDRRNGPVGYHVYEIEPHRPIYPYIDQMSAVTDKSQIIGGFLDWLTNDKHLTICEWDGRDYTPTYASIEKRLAEYFEIDLDGVEADRSRYLEDFRRAAEKRSA